MKTKGIHHVSSIVGHAQRNLDFNASVLSLRLLKKTLNYDDIKMYHLYYGNRDGSNGIVTTFPMVDAVEGRRGDGQVSLVSYAVNKDSFPFWKQRLKQFGIESREYNLFGLTRLGFSDPDGLAIEFIENDSDDSQSWAYNGVENFDAFKGIYSSAIYSKNPQLTLNLLVSLLGYELIDENNEWYRLRVNNSIGGSLELSKESHGKGQIAVGTVHHIAFKVEEEDLLSWRKLLLKEGYEPTEIKNRNYF